MDEELRAFVRGELVGLSDDVADLQLRLTESIDEITLMSWINWSHTRPWAWNALQRRLRWLDENEQPIPRPLQLWAIGVASGRCKPPRRNRNDDRDFRIVAAVRVLTRDFGSQRAACREVAEAVSLSFEAVQDIVRNQKKATPFPRSA